MPGPPPKPNAVRRRSHAPSANVLRLPAGGRRGEPPEWPFRGSTGDELALWAQLWVTPMAVAWERFEWVRVVARYVRLLLVAEDSGDAKALAEVRLLEDRLGLSPMSMLRLRWEITVDDLVDRREDRPAAQEDLRARLRKVE